MTTLNEQAQDDMFEDIEKMSLSGLVEKYGGIDYLGEEADSMDGAVEKADEEDLILQEETMDGEEVGSELTDEEEGEVEDFGESEDDELSEEEFEDVGDYEGITDSYDLQLGLINGPIDQPVTRIRTFGEFGIGFLGCGIVANIEDVQYQMAIRMAETGTLVQEAQQAGTVLPEVAFEGDVKAYLQGEDLPGLVSVASLQDAGDPAGTSGVSFKFDDGSDFRVYILGSCSEMADDLGMLDDLQADVTDGLEIKADQNCMKSIWQKYYQFYAGKYIAAAMQAWQQGNFPKAAAAFEKARDGFESDKNPAEYNCLESWRAEAESKAS